jgi:hypothetical protein
LVAGRQALYIFPADWPGCLIDHILFFYPLTKAALINLPCFAFSKMLQTI